MRIVYHYIFTDNDKIVGPFLCKEQAEEYILRYFKKDQTAVINTFPKASEKATLEYPKIKSSL